jgi:hypothetical protein
VFRGTLEGSLVTLKLAAILLSSAFALPGWGGDGSSSDEARAERIVLRRSDLPPGWRAQADGDDPDAQFTPADLPECEADEFFDFYELLDEGDASAESPSFESRNETRYASGSAAVAPTARVARELFDALDDGCMTAMLAATLTESEVTDEARIGVVDTEPLPVPPLGDEAEGGRVVAEIEGSGLGSLELTQDVVMVRRGRAVAFVMTGGLDGPVPADMRDEILERVAGRME